MQDSAMTRFPSLGAKQLLRVLQRSPLNYVTVAPGAVRKVLVKDVGLTEQEALDLLK